MMTFLITSVGTATSVGIIKNIRKYEPNARIIGTDINEYGYTAGSMLTDRFYRIPLGTDSSYESVLRSILRDEGVDVLWAVNDTEIRKVADWELDRCCSCVVAAPELIDLVQDKKLATEAAAALGLTVPEEVTTGYVGPAIVRNRIGVGSKGIRILPNLQNVWIPENAFAQRRITGQEYTVDTLCDRSGHPLYIIPRVRLEIKAGIATKTRIERNEALIGAVKTLLAAWHLPGFSNTQFIVDKNGDAYFIELNPRIGGFSSASLLAAEGMFPAYLRMLREDSAGAKTRGGKDDMADGKENTSNIKEDKTDIATRLNADVHWGMVVTRYYEEACYEP